MVKSITFFLSQAFVGNNGELEFIEEDCSSLTQWYGFLKSVKHLSLIEMAIST